MIDYEKFSNNVKNILVVGKNNQVGDMICSLPLYAALKKKYPDCNITLVAAKTNYPIPIKEINKYIDNVITLDRSSLKTNVAFLKELRKTKYQIGIVPSTITLSSTSHIVNYLSGAKIRVGVKNIEGKKNKTAYLLNVKSSFDWDKNKTHQKERNLDVVKQIDCDLTADELKNIKIKIDKEGETFANEYIRTNFPKKEKLIVGVHPGAGKLENIWNVENFKSLIKRLNDKYSPYFLITAGHTDKTAINNLFLSLKEYNIEYQLAQNIEFKKLAALLNRVNLYITNDTGPMHIADSVGGNVLALFGPTNSYEWGPRRKSCFSIQSHTKKINDITVDKVFDKSVEMLKKK